MQHQLSTLIWLTTCVVAATSSCADGNDGNGGTAGAAGSAGTGTAGSAGTGTAGDGTAGDGTAGSAGAVLGGAGGEAGAFGGEPGECTGPGAPHGGGFATPRFEAVQCYVAETTNGAAECLPTESVTVAMIADFNGSIGFVADSVIGEAEGATLSAECESLIPCCDAMEMDGAFPAQIQECYDVVDNHLAPESCGPALESYCSGAGGAGASGAAGAGGAGPAHALCCYRVCGRTQGI